MAKIDWGKLVVSIVFCQGAGLIGSIFTLPAIPSWYQFLNKPSFSPPNVVFGPVWSILYTLMGISFYLIWQKGTKKKQHREAIILFLIHLFFNASWSVVFFGLRSPLLGLITIVILLLLIVAVIYKFSKIEQKASLLLLPYLLWVLFATVLNYNIWLLNS